MKVGIRKDCGRRGGGINNWGWSGAGLPTVLQACHGLSHATARGLSEGDVHSC